VATLRKRGRWWQVQVRRNGRATLSRSFRLKSDALAWAHQHEHEAERQGLPTAHKALRGITVADILSRYRDEVVPRKRRASGSERERFGTSKF
jgi:hypothetical protein